MAVQVWFANMRASQGNSLIEKLGILFDRVGFDKLFKEKEFVAVKTHFGERLNTAFISPIYARTIIEKVKESGGVPFLTDSNTLYVGGRSNAVDHITTAIENGFGYATVKAPIVIADGLNGKDYTDVTVDLKHYKTVKIGSAAYHADALLTLTHFKGHEMTGFGGAIKNVGMGLGCRSGKQMMHADVRPDVDHNICIACGKCTRWCNAEALKVIGERLEIDFDKCIGCGECIVSCPEQAMRISWDSPIEKVQERIVEYALGAVKDKKEKTGYINFLVNITPDCDCWEFSDAPIVPDIGILASCDIVAIDQASADLVNKSEGINNTALKLTSKDSDKFKDLFRSIDWERQLEYAESVGLGSRKYSLHSID